MIRVGFGVLHGSQDIDRSYLCTFPLLVALFDYNPPTLQTDRRTDGRHARRRSATCVRHVALMPWFHVQLSHAIIARETTPSKRRRTSRTERDSGRSRLAVDPEGDPRDDDDEVARQVDLQQVVADLSLQPERHVENRSRTCSVVNTVLPETV